MKFPLAPASSANLAPPIAIIAMTPHYHDSLAKPVTYCQLNIV
jgi:hypothetical protein